MSDGYGSHADFWAEVVEPAKKRQQEIEAALGEALGPWVEPHETATVVFAKMTAADIAQAILSQPAILKPLVASCNIAARAIERDLGIRNLNTYSPILTHEQAKALAEYIKPFLPDKLDISAMSHLDRTWFIDKEIRAEKGRWEKRIQEALTRLTNMPFKKRQFEAGGDRFELDAATPTSGPIRLGVDVKRIEARRDIHKRGDEIVNKATKFKGVYPASHFAAVVYYPFIDEHEKIRKQINSPHIDAVAFAAQSQASVDTAVKLLLEELGFS